MRILKDSAAVAACACLAGAVGFALTLFMAGCSGEAPRVSRFGEYRGHSDSTYDGGFRRSDYLTRSDGTRLAYELVLPTRNGVVAQERLPVLFKYTPYLRTWTIFGENGKNLIADFIELGWIERSYLRLRYWFTKDGRYFHPLARTPWLERMVRQGYAVVVIERPGTGASFGVFDPAFETSAREADELLDWIAAQPWSNGKVGMVGDSFQAMVQFAAAGTGNPHLKAIFPASSPLEMYDAIQYRGGVYNKAFATFFAGAASHLETLVTPVDTDTHGKLLASALEERRRPGGLRERVDISNPRYAFRDSLTTDGKLVWKGASLYPFIERINRGRVAVYMTTGWYDIFAGDMFFWWENLTVPKRLTVRPLDHTGMDKSDKDLDYAAEAQRWFDHWLKGIDNGIMTEPPIHYYRVGAPKGQAWTAARSWPPDAQRHMRLYFAAGGSMPVASINDGVLDTEAPSAAAAHDAYIVDYTTSTGKRSRWTAVNFPHDYGDMRGNDAKALTYTTPRLDHATEVTGHPVVRLWIETDAPELDAFVYLEEVDPDGASRYVTEGTLRASHRALAEPPFRNLGLPFHSHYRSDLAPMPPPGPVELAFALLPASHVFARGSRIRVTVAFADADNFLTPKLEPRPRVRILRDAAHPSLIDM
jgi:uncharacterized protein